MKRIHDSFLSLFIFLVIITHFSYCYSQNTDIQIASDSSLFFTLKSQIDNEVDLTDYLYILEDSSGAITQEEILKDQRLTEFIPFNNIKQPLNPKSVYWGKFTIKNHLRNNYSYGLSLGKVNFINVYIPDSTGAFKIIKTGDYLPNSKNDEIKELTNTILIHIHQNEITDSLFIAYIKFWNINNTSPELNVKLKNLYYFEQNISQLRNRRNLLQGIFHGILWIIVIYSICMFNILLKCYIILI